MPRAILIFVMTALLVGSGVPALAQQHAEGVPVESAPLFDTDGGNRGQPDWQGPSDVPDAGALLGRFVLATGVVLALLVGGVWLFQRYGKRALRLGGGERPLRIVDRVALAPKRWVCLLHVRGRYLLIGVGDKEVSLLTELFPPDEPESSAGAMEFGAALEEGAQHPAPSNKR